MQIIGFSNYARVLQPDELAGLDWDMVQGTNLHHALLIAGRHLDRHPDFEPVVLVVTDGEPTAHLMRNGSRPSSGRRRPRRWSSRWPRWTR